MTDKIRILSIDGGGTRGIVPIHIIKKIEDTAGQPIDKLFDYITGTSIGGLLAAMYTVPNDNGEPKYDSNYLLENFQDIVDEMLSHGAWNLIKRTNGVFRSKYDSDKVYELLNEKFGESKLDSSIIPISSHAINISHNTLKTWSTFSAHNNQEENIYLKDLIGATSAAPTLFNPKVISGDHYVDGGLIENNPTLAGFAELKAHYPDLQEKDLIVVSLGVGEIFPNYDYSGRHNYGTVQWLALENNLINTMLFSSQFRTDILAQKMFPNYYRLEPNLPHELKEFDNSSTIPALKKLAEEYVAQNQDKIEAIVADLTAGNSTNRLKFYDQKSDLKSKLLSFASQISDGTKHFASITLDAIKYAGVVVSNSIHDAVAYMPLSSKGAVSFGSASNLASLENEDNLDLMDILDIVRVCDYDVDFHSL